jgi:hypothetical protein
MLERLNHNTAIAGEDVAALYYVRTKQDGPIY